MKGAEPSTNEEVQANTETEVPATREDLYAAVWSTPMSTLARRYGCSDRGLAKACERYRVPVPPRGYWAKLAVGQRITRPGLPKLTASELGTMARVALPIPSSRSPQSGTVAASVAEESALPEKRIQVRDTLHGAHPLVVKTREMLESAGTDDRGMLRPDGRGYQAKTGALAVHVSKSQVHRALRIFDALLKAIEDRGWSVICPAKSENRATGVKLLGEEVGISIEEKVKRFEQPKEERRVTKGHSYDTGRGPYTTILVDPYPRFGYERLGQLALRVPGISSPALQIADGATQKIEDRLDEFLVGIVRIAEQLVARSARWAAEERLREEERQRRYEIERQRAEEAARIAVLKAEADTWRQAEDIRAYVAAAKKSEPNAGEGRKLYFEWALVQADALDPLKR